MFREKCAECGRVFDLLNETDAQEWSYGHDCEQGATFAGYGGSSPEFETRVYTYRACEIRIPLQPEHFTPEEVAQEYGCFSGLSLDEAMTDVDETLAEIAASK